MVAIQNDQKTHGCNTFQNSQVTHQNHHITASIHHALKITRGTNTNQNASIMSICITSVNMDASSQLIREYINAIADIHSTAE